MRLEQKDAVDYIGLEKETGVIVATLVDDCDWSDEIHHLRLLQAKINRYFDFIESGEIYSEILAATNRAVLPGSPVKISVLAKFSPRGEGERFLEHVTEVAEKAGIAFSFKVVGQDSAEE